ncbi:MAG: carboxylesterase family protein [Gammaproteobacteria bacterium]|nr:carboxylesterase family protein [Gammaproteobacteria bacterium]
MKTRLRHGLFTLLCLAVAGPLFAAPSATPTVSTTEGPVSGLQQGGIAAFRGIPYADAPVGAWRWRAPRPAPAHAGTLHADSFAAVCPQTRRVSPELAGLPMAEDCLHLNIYTPSVALEGNSKLPVMVWIHGGSFRWGAGSWPGSEPYALVYKDLVVVTINYRLGRLGLFAHPALSASMADEPIANYALMDQLAALRWVQANIAAFGGDPQRVTIFGQSAGGISVSTLMAVPSARGLFSGAIAQSGAARIEGDRRLRGQVGPYPSLEDDGLQVAKHFGIANDADAPAKLRALGVDDLLAYSEREVPNSMNPVVDGRLLPTDISRIFRSGRQQPVPFITGTTDFEASLLGPYPFKLGDMTFGTDPDKVRALYPGLGEAAIVKAWFQDFLFRGPARFLAGEMARAGQPAWLYDFAYVDEARRGKVPGAAHSDDVAYAFGDLGMRRRWHAETPPTAADREMARIVTGYWVNFAKHRDPNGPGLPHWPRYDKQDDRLLDLAEQIDVNRPSSQAALRFLNEGYEAALAASPDHP